MAIIESLTDSIRAEINRLVDDRICIGVTGLSQSGKSTFITSFINQLRNHASQNARLGKFVAATNHKIHLVKLHPLEDRMLPMFDYDKAIKGLSGDAPHWPDSTTDISGVLIEIQLKNGDTWTGKPSYKSVYVEMRDYPGEWLVDLPMRNMNFAKWSRFIAMQLQQEPRKSIDENPFTALSEINPFVEYDGPTILKLRQLYCDFLMRCKNQSPPLSEA